MLSRSKTGKQTSIVRRLLITLGILLGIVLIVSGIGQLLIVSQIGDLKQSYRQSRELSIQLGSILEGMTNQETGIRGYVIARDEVFLRPFYEGRAEYLHSLESTRQLIVPLTTRFDDEAMRKQLLMRLDAVEQAAEDWYDYVRSNILEPVRQGQAESALDAVRNRQGKLRFDRVRSAVASLQQQNTILFQRIEAQIGERQGRIELLSFGLLAIAGVVGGTVAWRLTRELREPLAALEQTALALGEGNFAARVPAEALQGKDELAVLAGTFNQMAERLGRQNLALRERDILDGLRQLDLILVEEIELGRLGERLLAGLGELTDSQLGALYLVEDGQLVLQVGRGLDSPALRLQPGEGMIGLAASRREPVFVERPGSEEPLALNTPAGALPLRSLSAWPLISNQQLVGVLFLAGLDPLTPQARNLLGSVAGRLAIALLNSRSVRAIEETRARLAATFEQMSDGVAITDSTGDPLVINPAGRRILGLKPDEPIDSGWQKRIELLSAGGEKLTAEELPVQRAVRFGSTIRSDLMLRVAGMTPLLVSVSASPLKDERGVVYGVVTVFRDVTVEREREARLAEQARELEELNSTLKITNEELEMQRNELEAVNEEIEQQRLQIEEQNRELLEADRQKNAFLASMSHELRTPLNAILGFSQLLMRNSLLKDQPQLMLQLERIYQNGRIQLRLVNDILDLAKIKAGKIELQYQPVALEAFIREIYASLESLAVQKNLKVAIAVSPSLQAVRTDPQQLRTIVTNLLSNAFKYTERGEVSVRVRELPDRHFEIVVRDTGIGIAAEQQGKVFDEFSRLEGAAVRQAGTGLGLAICKRLVNLMGGQIELASVVGEGSTFTVRLPDGPPPAASRPPRTSPPNVLIIEDDLQVQQLIATRLAERPYRLLFAPDSIEGIQIARIEQPDAIVLDPALPSMDLWKVLFELRTDPATMSTPILLQSVVGEQGLAIPLGLADFLTRPVGQESLLAVLRSRRVQPEGEAILVVDDIADNREYLAACLRDEGYRVVLAASGPEALDYLENHVPQLVILDLMMPQMDGFEVLSRLRSLPGGKHLPVIILSAMDLTDEQRRTLLAQQTEQILKKGAQSIDELLALLDETLKRRLDAMAASE